MTEISFIRKIAKMGDKRVIVVPVDVYDLIHCGDLCKIIKVNFLLHKIKKCIKCEKEFIPRENHPGQDLCPHCLKDHNDKETMKELNMVFG